MTLSLPLTPHPHPNPHPDPVACMLSVRVPSFSPSVLQAMAALGLDTDLDKIRRLGPRPLILSAALWAYLLLVVGAVSRVLVGMLP